MPDDVLSEIKVSLGKIETTVDTVLHRVRNIEHAQQAFVPRREAEKDATALAMRLSQDNAATAARIKAVEEEITWARRVIMGAWLAGAGVVYGFGKKTGLF